MRFTFKTGILAASKFVSVVIIAKETFVFWSVLYGLLIKDDGQSENVWPSWTSHILSDFTWSKLPGRLIWILEFTHDGIVEFIVTSIQIGDPSVTETGVYSPFDFYKIK